MNFMTKNGMEIFISPDIAYAGGDEGEMYMSGTSYLLMKDDEFEGRMNQTKDVRKFLADHALKGPFSLPSNLWYFGLRTKSRKEF